MPRLCTACCHESRAAIDEALIAGVPLRKLAQRFGVGRDALHNHKREHLGRMLAKARSAVEKAVTKEVTSRTLASIDVHAELQRCFERANKLLDACDEFLTDPAHPDRYTLNPRAHEIDVVFLEPAGERSDGTEILATKRAPLDELLRRAQGIGLEPTELRWRATDPRRLVLEAVGRLERLQQWLVVLLKQDQETRGQDSHRWPDWRYMTRLLKALKPFPEAKRAVREALRRADTDDGGGA